MISARASLCRPPRSGDVNLPRDVGKDRFRFDVQDDSGCRQRWRTGAGENLGLPWQEDSTSPWTRWLKSLTSSTRKTTSHKRPAHKLALELLEDRTLLSASVWTDKPDYPPGSTAIINGSGFQAGETGKNVGTYAIAQGDLALNDNCALTSSAPA